MPSDKRNRPADNGAALEDDRPGDGAIEDSVRPRDRRRLAALRLPPLDIGRRDPLVPPFEWRPSSYGLTGRELAAEVARCRDRGWQGWEVRQVFVNPAVAA
jgi:hypothetical protein